MPSERRSDRIVRTLIVALAVVAFAYSFLIAETLLVGILAVALLVVLYLLWRFVRAHERIADALETGELTP